MTRDGGGLTRQHFAELLDRLGPRLDRWPQKSREGAARLLATDAEARAMLAASGRVAASLETLMQPEAALQPLRRSVTRAAVPNPSWRRLAGFGMAALAASLAFGFVIGTALPSGTTDDSTDTINLAVNDSDLGGVL